MARQGIATLEDPEAFLGFGGDPMLLPDTSTEDRAAEMIRQMESGLPTGRPFSALVGERDNLRITKNPYEILEDRRRKAGDLAVGMGLGLTADLAGLPADMLALIFSDAPKFAAALATGTPFSEMPTSVTDEGLRALRNVLGSDAIAGYLGVTEEALQRPGIESGRMLSSIVDPAVLALMLRPLIRRFRPGVAGPRSTDALAAAAAGDAAARAAVDQEYEELFGPGEDPMDVIGGRAGPQSPPGAPRAPEDGPDFGVDTAPEALPGGFVTTGDQPDLGADLNTRRLVVRGLLTSGGREEQFNSLPQAVQERILDEAINFTADGQQVLPASFIDDQLEMFRLNDDVATAAGTNEFDVDTDSIELIVEDFAGEPFNITQPEAGNAQLGNFGMFETPFMARNYTDVSPSQPIPLDPNAERIVDDPYQVYEFGEDLTDPVDGTVIPAGTAILWPERARDQLSDFFPQLRIDMDLEPPMQFDPNAVSRAAALRGTEAERIADAFDDHLANNLDEDFADNVMNDIMSLDDASAARIVNDELGIGDAEDIPADALFLIRGRNMGTFPREAAAPIVSDTPQQGFSGVVDTPPEQGPIPPEALPSADPNTGSQLMGTTALTQPFPVLADRVSIREDLAQIPAAAINRQGDVAAYSPLRQLIAALPEDRALSKDEVLRALDPNAGTEEYRNSVQRDIQGSRFDEWVKKHVSDDGITREELLSKYDQFAPQIRAINVLESDLQAGTADGPIRGASLPHSGSQESIDDDFIRPADNGVEMRGHIYLTNPTSATIKYRKPNGEIGEWALTGSDVEDVNAHGGMAVTGRTSRKPLGRCGALGYFGHVRYVVIQDAAGRKMMVVQEIQSNHTVTQARGDDVAFLTPNEQENIQFLLENPAVLAGYEQVDNIDEMAQRFDVATAGRPPTIEEIEQAYGPMGRLLAEQLLENTPNGTLLSDFNHRANNDRPSGGDRKRIMVSSFRGMSPAKVSEFNRLMTDRFEEFTRVDGRGERSPLTRDEIKARLEQTSSTDSDMDHRASLMYDVLERYYNAKRRRITAGEEELTPHKYLVKGEGQFGGEFGLYMSGDRTFFGDLGNFEIDDAFMANDTFISNYAAALDDYITSVAITRAKTRMDTERPPEGMSAERFEELKRTASRVTKTTSNMDNRVGEYRTMSPFAQTRHFEEFTPKLILQQARKAGFDGVIFPNYRDMSDVSGRPSTITVKNIYEKGVKKALNQLGVEVVDLPSIIAYDFSDGTIKSVPHAETGNSHRGARAVYFAGQNESITSPTKVLRRAKGGPVDLRPRKLVHSGIGAMARQVM